MCIGDDSQLAPRVPPIATRSPRDERNVAGHGRHRLEAAVEGQPQRPRRRRVCGAQGRDHVRRQRVERGINAVDPVPGEVAERDRFHTRAIGSRKREGWNVAHHEVGAGRAQHGGFTRDALLEGAVKGRGPARRFALIESQAVDLSQAGVGFEPLNGEAGRDSRTLEEPVGRRGANHELHVRAPGGDRVDQLDVTGCMPKPMSRHVKINHHPSSRVPLAAAVRPRVRERAAECRNV